ncbi:MAG TPA: hypothetical protein VMV72_03290 [Verrucomicrobiae bacterium]|nr:hypothetical protein [Verrucomicrobiae bacterium]
MIRPLFALVGLLIIAGAAPAERPGYLTAGRVAPLRFAETTAAARFVLPPASEDTSSETIPMPTNGAMGCESQTTIVSSPGPAANDETPETNDIAMTPQLLMGYYHNELAATNRNGGVVVPFGFVPPSPPPPPSSSASYSSP